MSDGSYVRPSADRSVCDASGKTLPNANRSSDEACYRLLIESVHDYAIFMLDPSGRVTTWNPGAERINGYRADEILGTHFSVFYPVEDVRAGKCEHELEQTVCDGRFEDEGWRLRKDGTRFWASVTLSAVRDETGTLVGFAKVTRDLTERVRAEEERLRRARAEASVQRKDDFFAIMGHELRNPLSPMVTAVHLLKLRGGRDCERQIAILDRQLSHMTRLLEDLVDVSRAMRGKIELAPELVEVGELVASAIDVASPLIEAKQHRLFVDVPSKGLLVRVDVERMTQVFGNVLNNAAKYTEPGGEIRVGARTREEGVELEVEDNGRGIAPDMLPRVFELFAQGGDRTAGGLGIGLAIAERLVKEHGGEIQAESAGTGKGSRFRVRLPLVAGSERREPVSTQPEQPPRKTASKHVLIVDDNQDAADMLREVLDLVGHDVRVAYDGAHAIDACRALVPDLVLLDIDLPDSSGYDVAQRIREVPGCGAIRVVALTGYASEADRFHALQAGFSDFVSKPLDVGQVEALVDADVAHS